MQNSEISTLINKSHSKQLPTWIPVHIRKTNDQISTINQVYIVFFLLSLIQIAFQQTSKNQKKTDDVAW